MSGHPSFPRPEAPVPGFRRGALTMMMGNGATQFVLLLTAPVLTRLYTPEDLGTLGVFVALTGTVATIGTARLELAIVIARNEAEARTIAGVTLAILGAVCALVMAGTALAAGSGALPGAWAEPAVWLSIAPAAFSLGAMQLAAFWLTRFREYAAIASGNVALQLAAAGSAILSGLLGYAAAGLVFGRLLAQLGAAAYSVWLAARAGFSVRRAFSGSTLDSLRRHHQFPVFNLPNSLVGIASRDLLLFAFTLAGAPSAAGHFTLARSVIFAPISFLSASLSQVYYREASELLGSPKLEALTVNAFRLLALIATPAFTELIWFGDDAFALAFGESWRQAGAFAAIFALPGFLLVFSSWPERIFESTGTQWVPLAIQSASLALAVVGALVVGSLSLGSFAFVAIYSVAQAIGQLAYLIGAFRVAGFRVVRFAGPIALSLALFAATSAIAVILETVSSSATALGLAAALTIIYYLLLVRSQLREGVLEK